MTVRLVQVGYRPASFGVTLSATTAPWHSKVTQTMKTFALAATLALSLLSAPTWAVELMEVTRLLSSESAKETLDLGVAVHWKDEATPTFAVYSLPDTYTGVSFSPSLFGGSRRHCVDAFENALERLVEDAKEKGFDAVVGLHPVVDDVPAKNVKEFDCKPGYKITTVSLMGAMAMSASAVKRVTDAERNSLDVAPRPPADGAIYLKLEPALQSSEAMQAIGNSLEAHAVSPTPPVYRFRSGPADYSGEADLTAEGPEAACRLAVANALEAMAEKARELKYSMLINIRSRLEDAYPPDYSTFECEVGKKDVSVNLQATLAAK